MKTRPYKHKLNILESGMVFCRVIGILGLAGVALYAAGCGALAAVAFGIAIMVTLAFIVLLCVERRQDRVMVEQAKREDAAYKGEGR